MLACTVYIIFGYITLISLLPPFSLYAAFPIYFFKFFWGSHFGGQFQNVSDIHSKTHSMVANIHRELV